LGTVVLGWGWKTFSMHTNYFVTDNIETQLIRHIARFHAIKENRTQLKEFCSIFFNVTFTFCAILDKNCSKKLHEKFEKAVKSCNIKFLETAQNIGLHIFWVFRRLLEAQKKVAKLQKLALIIDVARQCPWPNCAIKNIFANRLLHSPSLNFKTYKMDFLAIFTHLVLKVYKNTNLRCSFRP